MKNPLELIALIQGTNNGLVVHPMEGFDYTQAQTKLKIPSNYQVEAMIAIGKIASEKTLPPDLLKKEIISQRRPLSEVVYEGYYKGLAESPS